MSGLVAGSPVAAGTTLPTLVVTVTRATLVRYAGASGDFNPIHWNQRTAVAVGLPDVIAHGMLTMALGARAVTDWLGDPGAVLGYAVRFTRPVVVPDDDEGTSVSVDGVVTAVRADDGSDGSDVADIELTVRSADVTVLGRARLTVRLH